MRASTSDFDCACVDAATMVDASSAIKAAPPSRSLVIVISPSLFLDAELTGHAAVVLDSRFEQVFTYASIVASGMHSAVIAVLDI